MLQCDPYKPVERAPRERLPALGADCHFHVFGPEASYPYADGRSYTPPDASLAAYENLAATFGFGRAVIIQPSPYGQDNSRTLAVLDETRLEMRAVLVLGPDVSEDALADYHRRGVRGVRLNLMFNAGLPMDAAGALAERIRSFGWHLQFLADVSQIADLPKLVDALRVPVVFDHLGHVPAARGVRDPGFQSLLSLVREGRCFVKLSGSYRVTARAELPYEDARPFADALIAANPAQFVWGTDWPHPAIPIPVPDETELQDQFGDWVTDKTLRELILIKTPERLYGFGAASV